MYSARLRLLILVSLLVTGRIALGENPYGWLDAVMTNADGSGNPEMLRGWACQGPDFSVPLQVDLYATVGPNGGWVYLGTTPANVTAFDAPGIAAVCNPNPNHGSPVSGFPAHRFFFDLSSIPLQYQDGNRHAVIAFARNHENGSTVALLGSGTQFLFPYNRTNPIGNVDGIFPNPYDPTGNPTIRGWACDPEHPEARLFANFYLDGPLGTGKYIGQAFANQPRERAVGRFCNNLASNYGYVWPTAAILADGKPHTLYVYSYSAQVSSIAHPLTRSPLVLGLAPKGNVDGFLYQSTSQGNMITGISGWACAPDNDESLKVSFFLDGLQEIKGNSAFLGSTMANLPREAAVGLACNNGMSSHGFSFTFSPETQALLQQHQHHVIYTYASQSRQYLPSPNALLPHPLDTKDTLPFNAFGMGAAYLDYDTGNLSDPIVAQMRETELDQTLYLAGKGGNVRIWCQVDDNWKSDSSYLNECGTAIQRAYQLNLVPTLTLWYGIGINPNTGMGPNPEVDGTAVAYCRRKLSSAASTSLSQCLQDYFKPYSDYLVSWTARLPTQAGHLLNIEILNEPNFTDGWYDFTCNYSERAQEVAEFVSVVADGIHALGNPEIRVSAGALSPIGDSNPQVYGLWGDGTPYCSTGYGVRGNQLDIPATQFIDAMNSERPDLFGHNPKVDFWADHPYPLQMFGGCNLDDPDHPCPAPANDPTVSAYQNNLIRALLPKFFPVKLTEYGYPINDPSPWDQEFAANFFAGNGGVFQNVWLNENIYNNVTGSMGFILPIPGYSNMDWLDANQNPLPIFIQITNYRQSLYGQPPMSCGPEGGAITPPLTETRFQSCGLPF